MFLHQLTPEEQEAFLRLGQFLIQVDRVVDLREEAALDLALREMGRQPGQLPPVPADAAEALAALDLGLEADARRIVYLELVLLANCDRTRGEAEEELLEAVASRLHLSARVCGQLRDLAERAQALRREAEVLVSGDSWA